jgi:hypothetical protein
MKLFIALFMVFSVSSKALAVETGASLLGIAGTVVIHEAGHALATHFLGGEVMAFRPYPTKALYLKEDGTYEEKWVAGLVMLKKFEGENAARKHALVAAMGSGGNMLSVLLLAPLMPSLSSDFSKNTLDSMMFFSTFDAPAYIAGNILNGNPDGDWSQVSKLTGVSLYWYFLGALASSLVVNEYRYHFHKKSFEQDTSGNHFAVGFTLPY